MHKSEQQDTGLQVDVAIRWGLQIIGKPSGIGTGEDEHAAGEALECQVAGQKAEYGSPRHLPNLPTVM